MMEFDKDFLGALFEQAVSSPRRRQVCDLRTSPQDAGQRALCALLPGTQVPIHRHEATAERSSACVANWTWCSTRRSWGMRRPLPMGSRRGWMGRT